MAIFIFMILFNLVSCGMSVATGIEEDRRRQAEHKSALDRAAAIYESNHDKVKGGWVSKKSVVDAKIKEAEIAEKSRGSRSSTGGSAYRLSKSSGSTKKKTYNYDPIDPDDYDIEGYYEEYKDEFEDFDDAYDAFLDDEDAWEYYR